MNKKILRARKNVQLSNKHQTSNQTPSWKEKFSENRALIVLTALILLTVTVSSIAAWRVSTNYGMSSLTGGSLSSSGALVTGTPPTMPANAPSKEYVYAGSSLISTIEPFRETPNDLAVWRPTNGTWYILNSQQQMVSQSWGIGTDIPAPGDFDGDGKTDFCVYRPSNGTWYIINSSNGANQFITFGTSEDVPAIADYDGDSKADIAVWRPSNRFWYIQQSSNSAFVSAQFGATGDKPVPADIDGDGKSDLVVWRNDTSPAFYVLQSSNNQFASYSIGSNGDEPVLADYDGDGKNDYAIRNKTTGIWQIRESSTGNISLVSWGVTSDISVPGRYIDSQDNDAKADVAVWRPSTGVWYIRRSSNQSLRATAWGSDGDIPVPANWQR